jgi:hypothetical protein
VARSRPVQHIRSLADNDRHHRVDCLVRPVSAPVWSTEEKFGAVNLTQLQMDLVIAVTTSHEIVGRKWASTSDCVTKKIRRATGWDKMRRTPMLCRFAYKHGLVRL